MNVQSLSLSVLHGAGEPSTDQPTLSEVEPVTLQAVTGGWGDPPPTPAPVDPTGGFCGTVPHPHGPFPITPIPGIPKGVY
jgi:hypothetical protein